MRRTASTRRLQRPGGSRRRLPGRRRARHVCRHRPASHPAGTTIAPLVAYHMEVSRGVPKRVTGRLSTRRRATAVVALSCVAGWSSWAAWPPARAAPSAPPPRWELVNADTPVAANGVLLFRSPGGASADLTVHGRRLVGNRGIGRARAARRSRAARPTGSGDPPKNSRLRSATNRASNRPPRASARPSSTRRQGSRRHRRRLSLRAHLSVTSVVTAQACCTSTPDSAAAPVPVSPHRASMRLYSR